MKFIPGMLVFDSVNPVLGVGILTKILPPTVWYFKLSPGVIYRNLKGLRIVNGRDVRIEYSKHLLNRLVKGYKGWVAPAGVSLLKRKGKTNE